MSFKETKFTKSTAIHVGMDGIIRRDQRASKASSAAIQEVGDRYPGQLRRKSSKSLKMLGTSVEGEE